MSCRLKRFRSSWKWSRSNVSICIKKVQLRIVSNNLFVTGDENKRGTFEYFCSVVNCTGSFKFRNLEMFEWFTCFSEYVQGQGSDLSSLLSAAPSLLKPLCFLQVVPRGASSGGGSAGRADIHLRPAPRQLHPAAAAAGATAGQGGGEKGRCAEMFQDLYDQQKGFWAGFRNKNHTRDVF